MKDPSYDIIIVGTGAGGGTLASALAPTSANILLVERGDFVPQEPENADPDAVWKQLRYRTSETWLDADGKTFRPYTHYCVGGNTKFWGSAMFRLRREDFGAIDHMDGHSPAWPIDYDTLAPFYTRAEALYQVHGALGDDPSEPPREPFPHAAIPHEAEMSRLIEGLRKQGLHPSSLPLGLIDPGDATGCILCDTCNSFPCRFHRKADADVCCVRPLIGQPHVTLWTRARATRLITDPDGRRIRGVEIERDGERLTARAPLVVLSCGAVHSSALLLRSANDHHPNGLANSSGLVGRRYMAHLSTMMAGFRPFRKNPTRFQKTVAINDYYLHGPDGGPPLGQIQSQGRTHAVMAQTAAPWMPLRFFEYWVPRGVDWLAMTEDLPRADNRVTVAPDGRVRLAYRANNVRAHRRLVQELTQVLRRLGFWFVYRHSHYTKNTTHQCGTLCFGHDPRTSVLDTYCRSHDIDNLFVVDASFFPSSAAVNPGLTIAAQALRVADHIIETEW